MREVEYDPRSGEYDEPRMQGLSIRDLRYADDTTLLATTTAGLENLIKSVREHSEQKRLILNVKKTEIMSTDRCREEAVININKEEIERVSSFEYPGARIQASVKNNSRNKKKIGNGNSKTK